MVAVLVLSSSKALEQTDDISATSSTRGPMGAVAVLKRSNCWLKSYSRTPGGGEGALLLREVRVLMQASTVRVLKTDPVEVGMLSWS